MFRSIIAIKTANGEWTLDVLGNPYFGPNNGRDVDGEYFSPSTKFHEDKYPLPPVVYYHGFGDDKKPVGEPEYIGRTVKRWTTEQGVWYRVVLDQASNLARKVWNAAQQGIARASSGSNHLSRVAKTGEIVHWPVTELSLFEMAGKKRPANGYAVAVPVTAKVWKAAGLDLPLDFVSQPKAKRKGAAAQDASEALNHTPITFSTVGDKAMNPEELQRMIADGVAAALNQQREQDAAAAAAQAAFDAAVKTEVDKRLAGNPADRRLPSFEAPNVAQFGNIWKYDNLDETDLAIAIGVLKAARLTNRSEGPSENLLRALAVRLADMPDPDGQYIASKMAMKAAGMPVKANELNQSTLASYGDEWVGVTYSTQIWDKIRFEAPIVSKLPTVVIPQGSESIIIPLNSASPTFYKVAQASAMGSNPGQLTNVVTTSKMSTDKVTLTAGKMGAAVAYTGELEEDSLLPWASELRRDLTAEAAEVLEHLVIDGDVAPGATTNINHIGGTPGATDVYTLFDGFRKLALVTNTANSRDGGVLDVSDFLETVKLMGVSGINAIDRSKVSLLIDVNTHWWTLELPEVLTKDVFAMPTIESGALKSIWGYEVIPTANMHRASAVRFANTAGKVDQTTPGNNTKGSIVAVRWDRWRLGYKRRVTFEVERSAMADASTIVLMMRCGLLARDNEASAVSYNISKV